MSETAHTIDYRDWHLPYHRDELTLREAHEYLMTVGESQQGIPLMVQLMENPKYKLPAFTLFHGAVTLEQHDFIHLILGRGLLPKDEAFAIGFTMGTTKSVNTTEEALFSWIARNLYPEMYRFSEEDIKVFQDAVKLGFISDCLPLDQFDFTKVLDLSLKTVRQQLGLEDTLILAYYEIEKKRYPNSPESQRLI